MGLLALILTLLSAMIFVHAEWFSAESDIQKRRESAILALTLAMIAAVLQYANGEAAAAEESRLNRRLDLAQQKVIDLMTGGESYAYLRFGEIFRENKPYPSIAIVGGHYIPALTGEYFDWTLEQALIKNGVPLGEVDAKTRRAIPTFEYVYDMPKLVLSSMEPLTAGRTNLAFLLRQGPKSVIQLVSIVTEDGRIPRFAWRTFRLIRESPYGSAIVEHAQHPDHPDLQFTDADFPRVSGTEKIDWLDYPKQWPFKMLLKANADADERLTR